MITVRQAAGHAGRYSFQLLITIFIRRASSDNRFEDIEAGISISQSNSPKNQVGFVNQKPLKNYRVNLQVQECLWIQVLCYLMWEIQSKSSLVCRCTLVDNSLSLVKLSLIGADVSIQPLNKYINLKKNNNPTRKKKMIQQ